MSMPHLALTWQHFEKWALNHPRADALVFGDTRVDWQDFSRRVDEVALASWSPSAITSRSTVVS